MMRSALYRIARLMGDANAVRRGRVGRRVANKIIGRRIVRKLWR